MTLQPQAAEPCGWTLSTACVGSGWADVPGPVQTYAQEAAIRILWALSGRRYGTCTQYVRPCRRSTCSGIPPGGWWGALQPWFPMIDVRGVWINSCGCSIGDDCACSTEQMVILPGPVASISEVRVDGAVVPSSAYKVWDWKRLQRVDGGTWPVCQDFTKDPATDVGTFLVTYQRGVPVPAEVPCLVGRLAAEIAKACQGQNCQLSRQATHVARQGVMLQFVPFDQLIKLRLTGVPDIDLWLMADNPNRLGSEATVWSPDIPRGRRQTG